MIIQTLNDLYERRVADPELQGKVPLPGMSSEKVEWELIISEKGELVAVRSCAHGDGKGANRYKTMLVPEHGGRSGTTVKSYFLCDTAAYLLGVGDDPRTEAKHEAARALHEEVLGGCDDIMAQALLGFFSHDYSEKEFDVIHQLGDAPSGNLAFSVKGVNGIPSLVHEQPAIIAAWDSYRSSHGEEAATGQCSVTGRETPLARLFPMVKGLAGAQSTGASLVSFNCDSFNSYGKTQAYNASISESVAFGAGTVLRSLLADAERRVRLGDTVFTFWSDRPSSDEDNLFANFLGKKDTVSEDDGLARRVNSALEGIKKGHPLEDEGFNSNVRYYVLGISPNAARLSVRFFETLTLGETASRYGQYLRDIGMVDVRATSLFQLLCQCAVQGKYDNIPSTLVNPCARAMLTGARFPQSLLSTLLSRMRADHGTNNTWDVGQRASLMKACMVRNRCLSGAQTTRESELDVSLNRDNTRVGYLLGRLFAVMERAQSAALGTTNTTIRDKYIGSASVTPARVMPTLMHGCQNHLGTLRKKSPGTSVVLEKELDEIVGRKLSDDPYPATLSMDEQGEFFVGYYQERVDLWTSHKQSGDSSSESTTSDNPTED